MDTDRNVELDLLSEFPPPSWEEWLKAVEDTLKGADYSKAMFTKTYEGISLKPIYRKEDIQDLDFCSADPGKAPYQRGNDPLRRVNEGWLVAQAIAEPDLEKLNKMLLDELSRGLMAVNLELARADRPNGIKLEKLQDLQTALDGVDITAAPLFIQLDMKDHKILDLLEEYALAKGINLKELEAGIGFDPTGEFARKGSLPMALDKVWDQICNSVKWAVAKAPKTRVMSIDGTVYEAAGCSSSQELAFVLSTAIGYINGLQMVGFTIDEIAPLFQVKLSLGSNLFMEIAKIRAFRLLWAEMIRAFGGNERSQKIWIHGRSARFNKSVYDIYTNVLRTTTEAFSGVIGGADSLEIGCFDELIKPGDEFSRRIARNQQILLAEESHLNKVIDPAGGSYYIESLTNELANLAWKQMQELEEEGGMIKALRAGTIHERIAVVAKARIDAVNKRRDVFVGVNMFAAADEAAISPSQGKLVTEEIAVSLDASALPKLRAVQAIEALRARVNNAKQIQDTSIMLINMGSLAEYKARADFSTGFFQAGAFNVEGSQAFASVEDAVKAAEESNAAAYCICSTDDNYKSLVPELCAALKGKPLILAGYPADMVESYKAAGIDIFIHIRADLVATLNDLLNLMGVK